MEKYCKSCGRVFDDLNYKICPFCGQQLSTRVGRQPIPRKLRHQVFQRDGYRCRECGATNKQTRLHVDHIKPVAKGGTNDLSNLQTLCEACNQAKYTDEWVGGMIKKSNNNQTNKNNKKNIRNPYVYWTPEDIRVRYKSLNNKFLSQGKIVSASDLLNSAGVNYKEVEKGKLYKIYPEKRIYERIKKQKIRDKKPKPLTLDEIIQSFDKFSDCDSVRIISKASNVPVNNIYDWYSKGKQSIKEYVEFYEKVNEFTPDIAQEIEEHYQRTSIEKFSTEEKRNRNNSHQKNKVKKEFIEGACPKCGNMVNKDTRNQVAIKCSICGYTFWL